MEAAACPGAECPFHDLGWHTPLALELAVAAGIAPGGQDPISVEHVDVCVFANLKSKWTGHLGMSPCVFYPN